MSFTVSSTELQKHLQIVSGVVPPKSVLPILQNINFLIEGGFLQLTATDLENAIQTRLPIQPTENDTEFNLAIPSKILQDTLKALPEQPLRFERVDKTLTTKIYSDNGEYIINSMDGTEYPRLPEEDNLKTLAMPLPVLAKAIDKTLFACSTDEMRIAMTGVYFNFKKENATFVSTDAHRLVRYRRTDIRVDNEVSFILPQKALKLLVSAAGSTNDPLVRIEYSNRNVFFRFDNHVLVCRQIDARFPDYENVIPAGNPNKIIINKKELLSTLKRLDIYSNKTTHLGRFKFNGNLLEVRAEDMDFSNQATETLNCLYEGPDVEIGFNVSLMTNIIANVDTEELILEIESPGRAAILLPSVQEDGENMLMLLMPVILGVSY